MTLAYLGPIAVDFLADFQRQETGDPGAFGVPVRLSGVLKKAPAEQLRELVANRERRVPFAGSVGVLDVVWVQNRPQAFGFYLLDRCSVDTDPTFDLLSFRAFTIDALHIGPREPVVTRSARARSNDFALTARSLVVQPFWGEDADGEPFVTGPGGTAFGREYDPRTNYDPASPSTTSRSLRIHAGTVT